ncbi:Tox-REase-5 domain-containing protein [Corallococcus llansteffanensis]|uniref:Tox-REase-5 domain-containing protein n=1 Tax=Corallococcus llansteffanensis TaxID=2316731 RepID=A0A3A8PUI2_9BACT|nr:Tox-REase-5 domain-containing protein [Corallococcus llansteffanensis]RKH55124.1 hypothetical protein D7V93_23750 [Corallococcus llansteffanensis]
MRADVLLLCLGLLFAGCTGVETPAGRGGSRVLRQRRHPERLPPGTALITSRPGEQSRQAVELGLLDVEPFEHLLLRAGLDSLDELPVRRNPFTPEDAVEVLGRLMEKPVTLGTFPPRMAAGFLLREVLEGGDVSREELERRVQRFAREQVAVLRPDGYLAWALDGSTQQKVAPVEWKDGAFRAGHFELGRFYSGRSGVFRHADAQLRTVDGPPLAEVYDDADVINRTLDGAEDAFAEMAVALGTLLSHSPGDALAALRHLPTGLVALIASSPEYLERFQYMTRGEQIQEAARLTTSVIATWGTASATTRTVRGLLAGTEATVPVLSLSSQGTLVLERVAVPAGRTAAVLSGGPGAAIILQRANTSGGGAPSSGGPGRWKPARESIEETARRYQAQITHEPEGFVYEIDDVKFDGFNEEALLEAKGPGYEKFLDQAVEQGGWFEGFSDMVRQARRQLRVARGFPMEWHFAEQKVADYMRALFKRNGLGRVPVLFTPPD